MIKGDVNNTVDHRDRVSHQIVLCRVVEHFAGSQFEAAAVQRAFNFSTGKIAVTQSGIFMGAHLVSDKHARLGIGDNHVAISQRHTAHVVVRDISEVTHSDLIWLTHGLFVADRLRGLSITHVQGYDLLSVCICVDIGCTRGTYYFSHITVTVAALYNWHTAIAQTRSFTVMPNELCHWYCTMTDLTDDMNMQLTSGIAAFEAKEFRRAWQLLEPLSDDGIAEAQYRCAIMIQNGLGVIARPAAAAKLMRAAADQNLGLAQHSMGVMYLFGEGLDQDTKQAITWLEQAGASGLAGAWSTLGMIYAEGQGIDKDIERARVYYQKAGFDPDEIV